MRGYRQRRAPCYDKKPESVADTQKALDTRSHSAEHQSGQLSFCWIFKEQLIHLLCLLHGTNSKDANLVRCGRAVTSLKGDSEWISGRVRKNPAEKSKVDTICKIWMKNNLEVALGATLLRLRWLVVPLPSRILRRQTIRQASKLSHISGRALSGLCHGNSHTIHIYIQSEASQFAIILSISAKRNWRQGRPAHKEVMFWLTCSDWRID